MSTPMPPIAMGTSSWRPRRRRKSSRASRVKVFLAAGWREAPIVPESLVSWAAEMSSAVAARVLDHLAVVGQAARRDQPRCRRAAWSRRARCRRVSRPGLRPPPPPSTFSVMVSLAISPATTRRARASPRVAARHLGHLAGVHEHAAHLGGLVGAAQPALDAGVAAPVRAAPGSTAERSPVPKAHHGVVGFSTVITTSPTSLSAPGCRCRAHDLEDHASSSTRPSRALVRRRSGRRRRWRSTGSLHAALGQPVAQGKAGRLRR